MSKSGREKSVSGLRRMQHADARQGGQLGACSLRGALHTVSPGVMVRAACAPWRMHAVGASAPPPRPPPPSGRGGLGLTHHQWACCQVAPCHPSQSHRPALALARRRTIPRTPHTHVLPPHRLSVASHGLVGHGAVRVGGGAARPGAGKRLRCTTLIRASEALCFAQAAACHLLYP